MPCKIKENVEKVLEERSISLEPQDIKDIAQKLNSYNELLKNIDKQHATEETSSTMGSYDIDQEIIDNMSNGTYRKIDGMTGTLSLVNDIQSLYDYQLDNSIAHGFKVDVAHSNYVTWFIDSVKSTMQQVGVNDISSDIEMYDTDNDHTIAFWKDGLGLNNGKIDSGKIVVLNGRTNADGHSSLISNNAELILHEFSHSVTEAAMRQDRVLAKKIEQIGREVMKKLTTSNLLEQIVNPTVAEVSRAKDLLRYINSNPSEFLAYAISNQQVFRAMQNMNIQIDTFFTSNKKDANAFTKTIDMLKSIINKIISTMTNGPTAATAFNNAIQGVIARNMQIRAKMYVGETFNDYSSKVTGDRFEKVDNFMKEGTSKIEEKLKAMQILSPRTKGSIEDFVNYMSEIKIIQDIKESGVFQSIMHTMFRQTTDKEFAASFQLIRKIKTDNDKHQNSLKEINASLVHSWFKDVPSEQREAITDLLAADINALGLRKSDIADLLSKESILDSKINDLSKSIGVDEYLYQARDLGWYMMHGTAKNPLLQTNAYRIYHRMYTGSKRSGLGNLDSEQMIANIDKLSSLYALKFIDKKNKDHIVTLLNNKDAVAKSNDITDTNDYHVVDLAMHLYETSKADEVADFGGAYYKLMDKGYLRKSYKLPMKTRIVPEHLMRELIDRGYSKEATFSKAATEMRGDGYNYYIMYAPDYSVSRTQGAIHDIGYFDKVQQMSDIYDGNNAIYESNSKLVESKMISNNAYNEFKRPFSNKTIDEMSAVDDHLMPVLKLNGTIADFSIPISRANSENHMMEDRDIASVLASTVTHRSAKGKAIKGNLSVVNHLLAREFEHADDSDYVVLRRSTNQEMSSGKPYKYDKQYAMIPEYTRNYINSRRTALGMRGDPNSIRIHKDMIDDFIGYKDVSLANLRIGEGGKYFDMSNHPSTALRVEQLQYWIKKAVARYKAIIILLNPKVVVGNAISNFNIAMVHGIDPITYSKLFISHWKNLDDYSFVQKELMRTESERDAGMRGLDKKIESLKIQLASNPMHDLMEDGQFNMIIEDLDTYDNKEDHVAYQKRRLLEKAIGKEGASKAKDAIDFLMLTKDSSGFKGLEKLTTYNDILNRAIIKDKLMYEHAIKMEELFPSHVELDDETLKAKIKYDEAEKRKILNYIDQLFVNYSYLDNRYIKFANDVSIIEFTKYLFRALKTLKQVYDKKPLSMTIFLGLEGSDLMPSFFDENPYSNYAKPLDAIKNHIGLRFSDMAQKLLTPGSIGLL